MCLDCNDCIEKISVPYVVFRMDNGRFRHMLDPTMDQRDAVYSKEIIGLLGYEVIDEGHVSDVDGLKKVVLQVDKLNEGVFEKEPKRKLVGV